MSNLINQENVIEMMVIRMIKLKISNQLNLCTKIIKGLTKDKMRIKLSIYFRITMFQ